MQVQLIESWGTDKTVARAARVSFGSDDLSTDELTERDKKLIHYLAKHKHTSCFEHQGATLRLKVPIFIARQIQRHRTFSYNEISRRYVDTPPEFFWPETWRGRAENVKQGSNDEDLSDKCIEGAVYTVKEAARGAVMQAHSAYTELLDNGVAPELARMILPQNMYTEFYMTGSLRNFAAFLKLRLHEHAQLEARQVAQQVHDILAPLWPVSMEALMKYD